MPRTQTGEETFRAVINRKGVRADDLDYSWDVHYGPYEAKGTAKGVLTKELKWAKRYADEDMEITGWVERAVTNWEKIA